MTVLKMIFAAISAATICVGATSAAAEELMASRLGAILGQEREALSVVPDSRMSMLTSLPPAQDRGVATRSGIVYDRTFLAAQPVADGGAQWQCLSEALYFEARGETVKGQFAVAEVIMNRVKSGRFPGSACAVINQGTGKKYGCQFTYTCDGRKEVISEPKAFTRVGKVARAILDGKTQPLTDGATHYHTTAVRPKWSRVYTKTARIGVHLFYRHTWRSASN